MQVLVRNSLRGIFRRGRVVAFLVLGVAWVGEAAAQDLPELAVIGLHIEDFPGERARVDVGLLQRIAERSESVQVVGPDVLSERLQGREELVLEGFLLSSGRKDLDEGRRLYERAAPGEAIPFLEKAAGALEQGIIAGADNRYLLESLLLLAQARATAGDRPGALSAFERVVEIDALLELDTVNYPPKMVQIFEEARVRALGRGTGAVMVNTAEPGALVWLDGRAVGKTPVTVDPVVAGEHYLVVEGSDGRRTMQTVRVEADRDADMVAVLDAYLLAPAASGMKSRSTQVRRLYRALGEHLRTDLVLIGGQTPDGQIRLQLYVPKSDRFSKSVSFPAGDDPYAAASRVLPGLLSFVRANGDLETERVSAKALPLRVDANPVMTRVLFEEVTVEPPVTTAVAAPIASQDWLIWTGAGVLGAAGVFGLSSLVFNGEDEGRQRGSVTVGPLP